MEENNNGSGNGQPHILQRWISLGDVIVLAMSLIAISASYGKLSADLAVTTREVRELQARDITPGARVELAAMRAKDVSQDAQISDIREELRASRRELLEEVRSITRKLDEHDQERR